MATNGLDFGRPEDRRSPQLSVNAPLNVRAAPSGAEALSRALGMLGSAVAPVAQQKVAEQSFDSAVSGKLDAQLGKVDAKRAKEDAAYALGQKRGIVEKTTVDALSEWEAQYSQMDKSIPEDELVEQFNAFMRDRLGGLAADADAKQWILQRLLPAEQALRKEHRAVLAAQFREDMRSTAGEMVRRAVKANQAVDIEAVKQVLMGAGFSRGEATAEYVDIVGTIAVESNSPRMLDALIPEKWDDGTPGPRSIAALANKINQYRYYAEQGEAAVEREAKALAKERAEGVMLAVAQQAARGDVAGALAALDQAIANGAAIDRSDYSALVNFARSSRDDFRESTFNANRIAEFRLQMITDPRSVTPADVTRFVARNFPPGKDGFVAAQQFMDDYASAYKTAREAEANPKAKAYRSSLVTRYKPDTGSTQARIDRYAAGMLAFDLEFAESKDPEKALEAANKVFESTKSTEVTPVGSVKADVIAFTSGQMDAADFRKAYDREGAVESIRDAFRKGEITREQALQAARALQ